MNNFITTNNTNDLTNFLKEFPQGLPSNFLWMPVMAFSLALIIKTLADNDYVFYGDIKEGKFGLWRHKE